MNNRGPVLTMLAALGLALVLLVVNRSTVGPVPEPTALAAPAAAPAPLSVPAPPAPVAPPPPAFPTAGKYTGEATTTAGEPIPLDITVDGATATAYLCDGRKIEAWLHGTARDGAVSLTGRGPNRLTGRLDGDAITGTVAVAGHPGWSFTVRPATGPAANTEDSLVSARTGNS